MQLVCRQLVAGVSFTRNGFLWTGVQQVEKQTGDHEQQAISYSLLGTTMIVKHVSVHFIYANKTLILVA